MLRACIRNRAAFATVLLLILGCGDLPLSPQPHGHTVERWAEDYHSAGFFGHHHQAGKLTTWSRDRYETGLHVRFDVQDNLRYPIIPQALALVADTLYAMILPHANFPNGLTVKVRIMDLPDHVLAEGGGDFAAASGLPVNGQVEVRINTNIFSDPDASDHPRYISSISNWYVLLLHESLHVLGFGTSPKWDAMKVKGRLGHAVCGRKVDWKGGHWGFSMDLKNISLMGSTVLPWYTVIAPETFCALSGIGWEIR